MNFCHVIQLSGCLWDFECDITVLIIIWGFLWVFFGNPGFLPMFVNSLCWLRNKFEIKHVCQKHKLSFPVMPYDFSMSVSVLCHMYFPSCLLAPNSTTTTSIISITMTVTVNRALVFQAMTTWVPSSSISPDMLTRRVASPVPTAKSPSRITIAFANTWRPSTLRNSMCVLIAAGWVSCTLFLFSFSVAQVRCSHTRLI